jgi:hypothetical protein
MSVSSVEYPRPELRRTIIFGEEPRLDPFPVEGANGRLIPGPEFSQQEFDILYELAHQQATAETLDLFILPSIRSRGRISINDTTGCWELPVYEDPKQIARYGKMNVPGVSNQAASAHRTMYGVLFGTNEINDPSIFLDHLCENKPCCYPRHLEPVSSAQNSRRARQALQACNGQPFFEFE